MKNIYFNVVDMCFRGVLMLLFFIQPSALRAQCPAPPSANCQGIPMSELILSSPGNVDFTFDGITKYNAGITQSGSTILRIKVLPNNASCKWVLRVYIDNNPSGGTPGSEWESIYSHGLSGSTPVLDLLQIKIYNACNTPISSGIYRNFTNVNGSYLDIINSAALIAAGSCLPNVNSAGTYLTNYTEFSFTIDYRIVPKMIHTPGTYQISLRYCLVEDI